MSKPDPDNMTIEAIRDQIAHIDRMFDEATGWGSWMSTASKSRKHLVQEAARKGVVIDNKHEIKMEPAMTLTRAIQKAAEAMCVKDGFAWDDLTDAMRSPNGGADEQAYFIESARAAAIPIMEYWAEWHEEQAMKFFNMKSALSMAQAWKAHEDSAAHIRAEIEAIKEMKNAG